MWESLTPYRLPAAAFIIAAAYVPGLFTSAYMPRWWAMAILLPLVSDIDPRAIDRRIGAILLSGLVYAASSLVWTPIPAEGFGDVIFMALLSLAMLAAAGERDLELTVAAFGWGIAASAAIMILFYFGYAVNVQASGRGGLFLSTEIAAEVAAPVLVWALWKGRWFLGAFMVAPIYLSGSRIALVAVAIGAAFGWDPRSRTIKIAMIFSAIMAATIAAWWLGLFGIGKISSGMNRVLLWSVAVETITPFGRGLGWWPVGHPDALTEYVHSDPLQLMVDLGAGALILLAVPVMVLRRGVGDAAVRSAFVALCLESAVSFPFHVPATAFLAALLAGRMASNGNYFRGGKLQRGTQPLHHVRWKISRLAALVSDFVVDASNVSFRAQRSQGSDRHLEGVRETSLGRDRER